jgi:hypothetical protein
LLAHGWWFSLGTPASSTNKTGRHDITEILLKVALNTKNQSISQSFILNKLSLLNTGIGLDLWCLMALSRIFQLYC